MISLDFDSGQIDVGDSKLLVVTPKDENGDAFAPSTLSAVFTAPSGAVSTYAIGDFDVASFVYSLRHLFDESGLWSIVVTATDANANQEVENGTVPVY